MAIRIIDSKIYSKDDWEERLLTRGSPLTRRAALGGLFMLPAAVGLMSSIRPAQAQNFSSFRSEQELAQVSYREVSMSESTYNVGESYEAQCTVYTSYDYEYRGSIAGACWDTSKNTWWGYDFQEISVSQREELTVEFSNSCINSGQQSFWGVSKLDRASAQFIVV